MKTPLLSILLGIIALAAPAHAVDRFFIFKASAAITVNRLQLGGPTTNDKIVAKTLAGNDLINLTLARPLGTKVDAKKAVLALAVVIEGPGLVPSPKSKLVIYNPDPTVIGAAKLTTIATLSNLDFDLATLAKSFTGQGVADVNIPATTTGQDPVNNKFFAATLNGSAQATVPKPAVAGNIDAFTFTLRSLSGPLHFLYQLSTKTTDPGFDFDGTVMKGMLKTTGKPITFLDL
jgi:hypothetical protein